MKTRTIYECDHCKKRLINKSQMKEHEPICFKNPESSSCITCKNFVNSGEDEDGELYSRFCKKEENLKFRLRTNCVKHQDA